ncbi:MAG: acetyl-CoA carboxylase carboxyltransferase subunit alpha [candidate division WOR-3 bacterium]|nr:acetyl-CoA carboxylase carboxyltransferase subunit alpha [candidate division WOR-3 bacterium]MCX7837032.1 acetyl-CoA carboxylase carboxyltransferase subunit alpha [candidate division WOR-3 bacterium]MDW8114399.1 acetyl-CoA carboxylase carboxyltransferase subunit alpha [candidate division WOR-3 bacterium]
MREYLDFEKPIVKLIEKIEEAKKNGDENKLRKLENALIKVKKKIFEKITPWQRVLLARHPQRPYTLDYIERITEDFIELHGDRRFGDDLAIVGGVAKIEDISCVIVGHQKGRETKDKLKRNFGMPHPEGYRKALRIMKLGEKYNLPIISFIDTPGAFPGIGAEERGQAQAIAETIKEMSLLTVPIVVVIIGEGGSGGALAIAIGNRVLMMENAIYSVISPEGCASILWRDGSKAEKAAEMLKLTAEDLLEFGIIDEIVKEPLGGAHQNWDEAAKILKEAILRNLRELIKLPKEEILKERIEKFRKMGIYYIWTNS